MKYDVDIVGRIKWEFFRRWGGGGVRVYTDQTLDTVGTFGTCIKQRFRYAVLYRADLGSEQYHLVSVSCKRVGYCTLVIIMSLFQQSQQRQLQCKRKRNVQMQINYEIEKG